MVALNTFLPGVFPEHKLSCAQPSNGAWHCSPVEQQCDSFVELGVVCINYETLPVPVATTQSPTTQQGKLASILSIIMTTIQLWQ